MSEPLESAGPAPEERAHLKRVVEALLFASDSPVTGARLAQIADGADGHEVRAIVKELQREYESEGRAFRVVEVAGGFQLLTMPEFAPWVKQLYDRRRDETFSKAALEALAIIAYRQPITRAEVEDIRGVGCDHVLRSLVERRLVRVTGRSEELGRPLLYGTTRQFLEAFGLRSLGDLPKRKQLVQPKAPPAAEAQPAPPPAAEATPEEA